MNVEATKMRTAIPCAKPYKVSVRNRTRAYLALY